MVRSTGIYLTAWQTFMDTGRYSEVARQMGVSPSTAKRWAEKGRKLDPRLRELDARTVSEVGDHEHERGNHGHDEQPLHREPEPEEQENQQPKDEEKDHGRVLSRRSSP
jgi:transposase-like protein